jgi:hypothetical protein
VIGDPIEHIHGTALLPLREQPAQDSVSQFLFRGILSRLFLFQQVKKTAVVIGPHADILYLRQRYSRSLDWWSIKGFKAARKEDPFRRHGARFLVSRGF